MDRPRRTARRQVLWAGVLLGAGFAALANGIVFRELLGWHHVLDVQDARLARLSDGIAEAVALALVGWGVWLLVQARARLHTPRVPRRLWGAILVGAGAYVLLEGLLFHHVLGLHHVNPGGATLLWDLAYLALGAVLALVGALMLRGVAREVRRMEEAEPHREHRRRHGLAR